MCTCARAGGGARIPASLPVPPNPSKCCVCLPRQVRLPPEVNRVVFVRNLPYKISAEEMYDIFGRFGAVRQIRVYDPSLPSFAFAPTPSLLLCVCECVFVSLLW